MSSLLARATQLIFGKDAGNSEFGQIGSQSDGAPVTTKDLAVIQSLTRFLNGLYSITSGAAHPPFIQDINSLYFLITSQLAYIFQAGIAEYDPETNYFNNISYVQVAGVIYQSINGTEISPNLGNAPASSPTKWRALIDTDTAMTANSDLVVPSQKVVKVIKDALATEVSDRGTAISAEASARSSADSSEASDRASADTTLQNNITALTPKTASGIGQFIWIDVHLTAGNSYSLPSGGTWAYNFSRYSGDVGGRAGIAAGGSVIQSNPASDFFITGFAWRIN